MKVWYIIKGNGIKSYIEDEDGYYVLEVIWVFNGRINKRPKIKQVLKEPQNIEISHRTPHFSYNYSPTHFILVNYPALREALIKFKKELKELDVIYESLVEDGD